MSPGVRALSGFVGLLAIAFIGSALLAPPVGAEHCQPIKLGGCDHPPEPDAGAGGQGAPATPPPGSASTSEATPSQTAPTSLPSEAAELLRLLNEERARHGLAALEVRADLTDIATQHSLRMAEEGRLYHNDGYFSAATTERIGPGRRGENVAKHPSAAKAHDGLMRSPAHRANILDPRFTHVGVGAAASGGGMRYFTQNFLQPSVSKVAAAPAPAAPVSSPPASAADSKEVVTVTKTVMPPPTALPFQLTMAAGHPSPPRGPSPSVPPFSAAALLSLAMAGGGVWYADQLIRRGAVAR